MILLSTRFHWTFLKSIQHVMAWCHHFMIPFSPRLCFYQTRSAWSMDQGSTKKRSAVHNFFPTVTKFCVMWEGLSLPHDTKFGNCMGEIVDRRMVFIWSLIHGSGWSRLIKAEPDLCCYHHLFEVGFPNLEEKCILTLFRSLVIFGLLDQMHNHHGKYIISLRDSFTWMAR